MKLTILRFAIIFPLLTASIVLSAMAEDWDRKVAQKGDVSIEFFVRGRGPVVLMHPGAGRSAQDYHALSERLAKAGFKCVAINPRGVGGSKGPVEGLTLHDYAADVWLVADALGTDKAHLLGHAFGSRVMRMASGDQPRRTLSVTLLAAGGEGVAPTKEIQATFAKVSNPNTPPEEYLRAVGETLFAPGHDPSPWRDGWNFTAMHAEGGAVKRTDQGTIRNGGAAAILVLQCLDDKLAPPQNAWNLATTRPNVRLVAVPDCGHEMLLEQPRIISDTVISFLKEQP